MNAEIIQRDTNGGITFGINSDYILITERDLCGGFQINSSSQNASTLMIGMVTTDFRPSRGRETINLFHAQTPLQRRYRRCIFRCSLILLICMAHENKLDDMKHAQNDTSKKLLSVRKCTGAVFGMAEKRRIRYVFFCLFTFSFSLLMRWRE